LFLFVLTGVIFMSSCSGNKSNTNTKDSLANTDTSLLSDKNFPIKNLQNLMSIWEKHKFQKDKMYADSTYKISFTELTTMQKLRLIVPFIRKELQINNDNHIENLMQAYFVYKQDKVGDSQPIILYINGDEYSSLTLIVLNKDNLPIDGFNLFGGLDSGPYGEGDSLTIFPEKRYSFITNSQIMTYSTIESEFNDSLKKPSIIDSNVFKSYIDKSGKIITKQVVKAQYKKPYKP
jgi:hypothetical protein